MEWVFTILIDGSPKIILLAIDSYEDFIDIKCVAITSVFAFQSTSIQCAECDAPQANRLAGDGDAPFGKQVFDISVT